MNNIQYNIFGSKNSLDTDIMVAVPEIPSIQECKELCLQYEDYFKTLGLKDPNINLCVVYENENSQRYISDVFKGTIDEVNNSLYHTYKNHNNENKCLVNVLVERDKLHKLFRMTRIILSFLSRTKYRTRVKELLKNGSLEKQLDFLYKEFFFSRIDNIIHPRYSNKEVLKTIFFQLVQTYALYYGDEIYDKEGLINFPLSTKIASKCINRLEVKLIDVEFENP